MCHNLSLYHHYLLFKQVHRRIWPTSQRESLFWSQRLNVTDLVRGREGITDSIVSAWMVCNHDTNYIDVPLDGSSNIRVKLTIAMVCQTILVNPSESANKPVDQLTRDDIQLKIIYVAEGNFITFSAITLFSLKSKTT